jgi:hypothetical protein
MVSPAQKQMCYRAQIIPIAPVWGNIFKLRIDCSYFLILDYYLFKELESFLPGWGT